VLEKPNFFIAGTRKCGTTALAEYLRSHPRIVVSTPKEPYFFAEDFPALRMARTEDAYLSLFHGLTRAHIAAGEASAGYLYSQTAFANIKRFNSGAKILFLLRRPDELVHAFHRQAVFDFDDDVRDFESAWRLQEARRRGEHIPARCRTPFFLQYRELGNLGTYVERALALFPRENVKFILLDDLATNPREVYRSVLSFLRVPDDGRRDFPRVNENRYHRLQWLGRLNVRPPRPLAGIVRGVKAAVGLAGVPVLDRWTTEKRPRPPLPPALRKELIDEFRGEVSKLAALLNRDLSHWLEIPSRGG